LGLKKGEQKRRKHIVPDHGPERGKKWGDGHRRVAAGLRQSRAFTDLTTTCAVKKKMGGAGLTVSEAKESRLLMSREEKGLKYGMK